MGTSLHAPLRGATWNCQQEQAKSPGFNPRPPESAMLVILRVCFNPRPLRGATGWLGSSGQADALQSTPPCGERSCVVESRAEITCFNPRPLAGSDPHNQVRYAMFGASIHAPLRGATPAYRASIYPICRFNPRPLAGSDCILFKSLLGNENLGNFRASTRIVLSLFSHQNG